MKSSGGGRKRGRPVTLSPDEKLKSERERWRKKKAAKRKREADAHWQRGTNFGYFERLWIPHFNELTKVLVAAGYLHEDDTEIASRVDAAVDALFEDNPYEDWDRWNARGGRSRRLSAGKQGTVRIKMTAAVAERLAAYNCRGEFERTVLRNRHRPPELDPHFEEELRRAETRKEKAWRAYVYTRIPLDGLRQGQTHEYLRLKEEHDRATAAYFKLWRRIPRDPPLPKIDEDELAEFVERRQQDRQYLRRAAEEVLASWYCGYVLDLPHYPCNCKLALPACDCIDRFKPSAAPGILAAPPKPKRPKAGKVIAKKSLYSAPKPRWWRDEKPRYENDPILRSHVQLTEEPPRDPDDEKY